MILTDHERRILAYLDQRGPTHRREVVQDLASPDSKTGRNPRGIGGAAAAMVMARWCRRLAPTGYVSARYYDEGYYRHHAITEAGRRALRADPA